MVTFMVGVATVFGVSTLAFLFLMWRAQPLDDEGPVRSGGVERANHMH